jgi:hypothetical protein
MKTADVSKFLGANENDQHDELGRFASLDVSNLPFDKHPPKIIEHKEAGSPDKLSELLKPPTLLDPNHVTYAERMKYEDGQMSKEDAVQMFQKLNNSGEAYRLQPHYGKTAAKLIKAGVVKDIPLLAKTRNFYADVVKEAPKNIAWELTEGGALTAVGAALGYFGSKLSGKKSGKTETVATNEITLMKPDFVNSYLMANGAPLGNKNAAGSRYDATVKLNSNPHRHPDATHLVTFTKDGKPDGEIKATKDAAHSMAESYKKTGKYNAFGDTGYEELSGDAKKFQAMTGGAANEAVLMQPAQVGSYLMGNTFNPDQKRDEKGRFVDSAYGDIDNLKMAKPSETDPNHVDVGEMMKYEDGSQSHDETVNMFQRMHTSGLAYQLQGHYGHTAQALLKGGYIHDKARNAAIDAAAASDNAQRK